MADAIEQVMARHVGSTFPGAVVLAAHAGEPIYRRVFGHRTLYPQPEPMTGDTIFDLASLSKPLGTTLVALALIEQGKVSLENRVDSFLPDVPPATGALTLYQLLTHTGGLPPVPALQRYFADPDLIDRGVARRHLFGIAPESPPSKEVVYSCTGFQLLGEVLEAATGTRLDELHLQYVARPLGLKSTRYLPPAEWSPKIAGTEYCRWRERWIRGEVHDESAYAMGGIAGNAGLFSTVDEVLAMSELYRNLGTVVRPDGTPYTLASRELIREAVRSHTDGMAQRRGLGLQVNSRDAAGGPDFCSESYGHTGFTGTSFWIDPLRDLTVVTMTNRLQYGRDATADAIKAFRREFHSALIATTAL